MTGTVPEIDRERLVGIVTSLVSIPSVSGDELAIMEHVAGMMEGAGIRHTVTGNDPQRPNVIASIGNGSGPVVAMNGHLDTVPVSDPDRWLTDPLTGVLSEDGTRIFGRGSSDMKGAVGVMLYVMMALKDEPLNGTLQAHVVSDEERGADFGTKHVLEQIEAGKLPRPDYVLIGEGSQLKVRNAERGIMGFRVRFIGRASHTAAARVTGINAIMLAAKGILALEGDLDKEHPAVGKPVISVNKIAGGIVSNVVPGECVITVDRRTIPGETRESVLAEVTAQLDAVKAEDPRFDYEILPSDEEEGYTPANITEQDSPVVRMLQESVRAITGKEPEFFRTWAGATDGRLYRFAGIDTVGFGPNGENAHGANEAVFVDDLVTQAQVYMATARRILG
ncbi:MAG TPA: M20/M25/M40 family metallo-hydrolase [Thermomicrobiales bacterium]|nr:M20/M25/M40 family metallo-hydrolase [Thermomicrobiales bacterium]